MKKAVVIGILLTVLSLSCFEEKSDFTRITIFLGNPIPADVGKIHIGVFAGIVSPATLIMTQSVRPNSVVILNVPSGWPRTFVVAAENNEGLANYSGVSLPVNVEKGETTQVGISIIRIEYNLRYTGLNNQYLLWDAIPGADMYTILGSSNRGQTYDYVYNSLTNQFNYLSRGFTYKVYANFTYFNLNSVSSLPFP